MIKLQEPYATRPIRFLELWQESGWDLRVICFERQAWLDAVLANPAGPDLEAYLACRLSEDV